jgi:6-pyruvoyl-tetrahydropterin synthase
MIAHSFHGSVFGPAQNLHGATYVVDVTFKKRNLDSDGLVVDIGIASEAVRNLLGDLNYRNLDEEKDFHEKNTTTEFLCKEIFDRIITHIHQGGLGPNGSDLSSIQVTLKESHIAWATYEGKV